MFFYEKIVVFNKISTFDNFTKAPKNPIKTDALFCNIFGFDVLIYYFTTKILQNLSYVQSSQFRIKIKYFQAKSFGIKSIFLKILKVGTIKQNLRLSNQKED